MRYIFLTTIFTALITAFGMTACGNASETSSAAIEPDDNTAAQNTAVEKTDADKTDNQSPAITNGFPAKPPIGTKAVCPVMKNAFTVSESTQISEYNGKFYAFCCPGCKPQFDQNPEKYL